MRRRRARVAVDDRPVRGRARQRRTARGLAEILLGERGGPHVVKLRCRGCGNRVTSSPSVPRRSNSTRRAVRSASATSRGSASRGLPTTVIASPAEFRGYERGGNEYFADELGVDDDPFSWELQGNCAFATKFEYTSD